MSELYLSMQPGEAITWTSSGNSSSVQVVQKFYDITVSDAYFAKKTVYSAANFYLTNHRLIIADTSGASMSFDLGKLTNKWVTGNGKEFFNFTAITDQGIKKFQLKTPSTFVSQTEAQNLFTICPVPSSGSPDGSPMDGVPQASSRPSTINNVTAKPSAFGNDPELAKLEAEKAKVKKKLLLKRKLAKARKYERQLDHHHALDLYRELDLVEDIRRVNKTMQGQSLSQSQPTTIVHGNYIDDRDKFTTTIDGSKTEIHDSVVSNSSIGSKKMDASVEKKIEQLRELLDEGLITEEIFEAKKQMILLKNP